MIRSKRLADGRYECQNCLKKFTKNPKAKIEPKFCCDNCRKEFHTTGGMSYRKLKDIVRRIVFEMDDERGIIRGIMQRKKLSRGLEAELSHDH